jgi:hypothetical protein
MPEHFDLMLGQLDGLNDVTTTKQSTAQSITPLVGHAETFIVQTFRQAEIGDTVFLQVIGAGRSLRLVIPPIVTAILNRQRDALTTKNRVKGARAAVAGRKANGFTPPGFTPAARAKAQRTRTLKAERRRARLAKKAEK